MSDFAPVDSLFLTVDHTDVQHLTAKATGRPFSKLTVTAYRMVPGAWDKENRSYTPRKQLLSITIFKNDADEINALAQLLVEGATFPVTGYIMTDSYQKTPGDNTSWVTKSVAKVERAEIDFTEITRPGGEEIEEEDEEDFPF